jgi:hypothetical protein
MKDMPALREYFSSPNTERALDRYDLMFAHRIIGGYYATAFEMVAIGAAQLELDQR